MNITHSSIIPIGEPSSSDSTRVLLSGRSEVPARSRSSSLSLARSVSSCDETRPSRSVLTMLVSLGFLSLYMSCIRVDDVAHTSALSCDFTSCAFFCAHSLAFLSPCFVSSSCRLPVRTVSFAQISQPGHDPCSQHWIRPILGLERCRRRFGRRAYPGDPCHSIRQRRECVHATYFFSFKMKPTAKGLGWMMEIIGVMAVLTVSLSSYFHPDLATLSHSLLCFSRFFSI